MKNLLLVTVFIAFISTISNSQIELISNGSFASGSSGWSLSGNFYADLRFSSCRSCPGYAYLSNSDGSAGNNLVGSLYQTIIIPSNPISATLTFWYYITTQETGSTAYDVLNVTIQNSSGGFLATVAILSNLNKGTGYSQVSYDVSSYKGQTIRINFLGTTDGSYPTTFRIDDVSILATTCSYSLSPLSQSFSSSGGSNSLSVIASGGCSWTATSNAGWISITSGNSGTGNGTVYYSVSSNASTSSRIGTMTIGGQTFTVNQDGISCSYSISPTSQSSPAGGVCGSVNVTTSSSCSWNALSNDSWISIISGSSGTGNGIVNYSITTNSGANSRTGTMIIAGQTFTVIQDGSSTTNPVITVSLSIVQTAPYFVGENLTSSFSINNKGGAAVTFDALTAGGRLIVGGQETCPNGVCPDFEFKKNIILNSNQTYSYQGNIVLKEPGTYHFFTAYKTPDGNWNTSIPTDAGVTNTIDISASSQPFTLSFPLQNKNPNTAMINSIFDHSMPLPTSPSYTPNSIVIAFDGEKGCTPFDSDYVTTYHGNALYGFKKDLPGSNFLLNGNYAGGGNTSYLYYDGHPGYDYRTFDQGSSVPVLAAAPGIAHQESATYGIVYIDHGNAYKTWYMHLVNSSRISEGTSVTTGQQVGIAGSTGTSAVHLHFEVTKNIDGSDIPVDPYGWQGSCSDPYPRTANFFLWDPQFIMWNPETVLPVELTSFIAQVASNHVELIWRTETEINNYGFEIERRTIGESSVPWNKIGFVTGSGTSSSRHEYTFSDHDLSPGRYAYRIKQIDNDGSFKYYGNAEVEFLVPPRFAMEQNYPNPFNPSTVIRYTLPFSCRVRLDIFNIIGQCIKELVNSQQDAGYREVTWYANVPSGCYFYRIVAFSVDNPQNNFYETKKLILLK